MANLEIKLIKKNTYYIPCPTNIGIYVNNNEATIIDTGIDKNMGKSIIKLLEEKNWHLSRIINTHSHADHIGGNAYLYEKTGCEIAAPVGEIPYIQNTLFEPSFLYGAYPFKVLKNKFLMAKPSKVSNAIEGEGTITGTDFEAISLNGHSVDMIGIRTPDNVLFIGDSLLAEGILEKYSLSYLWDIESHCKTLDKLGEIEAEYYVPSHGEVMTSLNNLIELNKSKIQEVIDVILTFLETPGTTETVLSWLCEHYSIQLNATQYVLLSSTLKSYLTYLSDQGKIKTCYDDYQLTWQLNG